MLLICPCSSPSLPISRNGTIKSLRPLSTSVCANLENIRAHSQYCSAPKECLVAYSIFIISIVQYVTRRLGEISGRTTSRIACLNICITPIWPSCGCNLVSGSVHQELRRGPLGRGGKDNLPSHRSKLPSRSGPHSEPSGQCHTQSSSDPSPFS